VHVREGAEAAGRAIQERRLQKLDRAARLVGIREIERPDLLPVVGDEDVGQEKRVALGHHVERRR